MSRLNLSGRQWPLFIYSRTDYNDLNAISDDTYGVLSIPIGAYVFDAITFWVEDAVVGPTTAEMVFTNEATGASAATTADLKGTPNTSTLLAQAGYYPDGYKVRLTVNKTGAVATAGSMRVIGSYIIDGRSTEVSP